MFAALKNHPFAVEAFFKYSVVLTFAVPKEELQSLIPECLQLDTLNDQWAFIAVAVVQTHNLRPKGFPRYFGNDFLLIGYRIFVKYTNEKGKRLRGLYILKSETDKKKMARRGNLFTHYNYTTTDITPTINENTLQLESIQSGLNIQLEKSNKETIQLPEQSPFADWKEARRFAGPLPFTFTYDKATQKVLIIEGVRQHWTPQPLTVVSHEISHLTSLGLSNIVLANAFIIENIPYYWKKGKIEQWKK
jgi:hypothetical protein